MKLSILGILIVCSFYAFFTGCKKESATEPPTYDTSLLNAIKFPTSPPLLDGNASDAAWTFAPEREVTIGGKKVTLKAVWSPYPDSISGYLWLLATWSDASFGIVDNGSWILSASVWSKSGLYEDGIEFIWDDPDTFIDKDVWYFGAVKTLGSRLDIMGRSQNLQDIVIDTTKFETDTVVVEVDTTVVPPETTYAYPPINLDCHLVSRKFTLIGYADDKYIKTSITNDDGGNSCYSFNANGDTTAPEKMEEEPEDFIDLMTFCSGEDTAVTDLNVDSTWAANYDTLGILYQVIDSVWTKVDSLGTKVVPIYILSTPSGSKADIISAASWNDVDKMWVLEMRRTLKTLNTDDIVFDISKDYKFTIKLKDNCSDATASISGQETLHFVK